MPQDGLLGKERGNRPGDEHRRHDAGEGVVPSVPLEHVERLHDGGLDPRVREVDKIGEQKDAQQCGQDAKFPLIHRNIFLRPPVNRDCSLGIMYNHNASKKRRFVRREAPPAETSSQLVT